MGAGLIGICHRAYGPQRPWLCFTQLKKPLGTELVMSEGGNVAEQRNLIVQRLEPHHEWVLFVDDDHLYPDDALGRLLGHGLPVVGAVIPPRRPRPDRFVVNAFRKVDGKRVYLTQDDVVAGRVIEVDAIGTGFTLIKARIFREMQYPWFELGREDSTKVGEDVWFCEKAKKLGYHIFADCGLRVAHLTTAVVAFDDQGIPQLQYTKADQG